MPRVDYTDAAGAYREARTLPPAVLAVWDRAVDELGLPRPSRVLDVGAGPGGFLDPLARWSGAPVVAVEPSSGMRAEAAATDVMTRHAYVAASAEHLPFAPASAGWAWLSTVVHQFDDLAAAAGELRRVLSPGGPVLIRGFLSDVEVTGPFRLFPGIERSAASFPSTDAVVSTFESAGFALRTSLDVVEPWRFGLTQWAEGVQTIRHTDSALRPLTDAEFEQGVRTVLDGHASAAGEVASDTTLRLLVLQR